MIVPPKVNTKERKRHDLNDLRLYFMMCEELNISNKEDIQESFGCLIKLTGNYKFMEEFIIFKEYVEKKKKEIQQGR